MAIVFRNEFDRMNEMYSGQTYKMSANTLLTWPSDCDSSRLYMNTAETKQSLTVLNPDYPRLSTGWENTLGKLNKDASYKQLDGTWIVKDVIRKYHDGEIFTVVLYNPDTNTWDMIENPVAEDLSEKFGYFYDVEKMNSLEVGDVLQDEVLYKSTAYDENMNYRYGKNAKVCYTSSPDTIEDAVRIRTGWLDECKTVEVDTVWVSLNNNHCPLNLCGDDDEYLSIPKFGEPILDSCVFALRPINYKHIMTEFKNSSLRKVNPTTDIDFYIPESAESYIYDINIFYNKKEEFPDNVFYHQINEMYQENCVYADKMKEWATRIKDSGDNYTDNIPFIKSIYQHWNDPEWQFCGKDKNKPIGFITIQFKIKSILRPSPGSKFAGRFGDKGVYATSPNSGRVDKVMLGMMDNILDMLDRPITNEERNKLASEIEIVPDDCMPYTDDFPVDIELNASGAIRRLNPGQIGEVDINFIGESIRKRVCQLPTREEKEELIFKYLRLINEDQCDFFYELYDSFDETIKIDDTHSVLLSNEYEKDRFIKNIEEHGFYIRKEHDAPLRYETIVKIYEEFPFIKPLPLYIDIFGIKHRRVLKDCVVGDKYMMILKHNSNKNFSARSTFRVNRANLPVKDTAKRDNRSPYSRAPIRIGEAYNLFSSISGELLAEYNIYMRGSTIGRKSLKRIIEASGNPLEIKKLKIKDNYINANADILACNLKGIGIGLEFFSEDTHVVLEDVVMPIHIGKYTIYDIPSKKEMYVKIFVEFIKMMESISFVENYPGHKEDYIWDEVFKLDSIKELNLDEETKKILKESTKVFYADN